MSGVPAAVVPAAVLRLSLEILRRHALTFAVLTAALSVAPQLLAHAMSDAMRRAMPPAATVDPDHAVFLLALYLSYLGGFALMVALGFAANVAITLIGLGPERRPVPLPADVGRTTLHLVAIALALWISSQFLFAFLPEPVALFIYTLAGWWALVIPVHAAERPPVSRLLARSWAVLAKGRWLVPTLALAYSLLATAVGEIYLHDGILVGPGPVAGWLARAAVLAVSGAVGVAAEVAVAAVYREARFIERAIPPTDLVGAFD